jgi:hypothetical protein
MTGIHTRGERAGGFSTASAAGLLPPLRTDSVNRGCCISLLTLAIVVLAALIEAFFFIAIPNGDTDHAQNLFAMAHNAGTQITTSDPSTSGQK